MKYYRLLNNVEYNKSFYKTGKIYTEDYKGGVNSNRVDELVTYFSADWEKVSEEEYLKQEGKLKESETTNVKPYYKGRNSLYQFAEEHELNSYEFDIIKRVARCRHKGNWLEDLEKTKGVIDIYIKECKERYNG